MIIRNQNRFIKHCKLKFKLHFFPNEFWSVFVLVFNIWTHNNWTVILFCVRKSHRAEPPRLHYQILINRESVCVCVCVMRDTRK